MRLRRNQAIVEYLAHRSEIDALLDSGHSRLSVFEMLSKDKRITMSLVRFYSLVRKGAAPVKDKAQKRHIAPSPQSDAFFYDSTKDVL